MKLARNQERLYFVQNIRSALTKIENQKIENCNSYQMLCLEICSKRHVRRNSIIIISTHLNYSLVHLQSVLVCVTICTLETGGKPTGHNGINGNTVDFMAQLYFQLSNWIRCANHESAVRPLIWPLLVAVPEKNEYIYRSR